MGTGSHLSSASDLGGGQAVYRNHGPLFMFQLLFSDVPQTYRCYVKAVSFSLSAFMAVFTCFFLLLLAAL